MINLGTDPGLPPGEHPTTWQPALDRVAGWDLDPGIRTAVLCLICHGVQTCQSCEGGPGHAYPEPTVDLLGDHGAGMHALSVAQTYLLPVTAVSKVWSVNVRNLQIEEVLWRLTFRESVRDVGQPPFRRSPHAAVMAVEDRRQASEYVSHLRGAQLERIVTAAIEHARFAGPQGPTIPTEDELVAAVREALPEERA